jgi:hypothetical protein
MLALADIRAGDSAIREDFNPYQEFRLDSLPASTLSNWTQIGSAAFAFTDLTDAPTSYTGEAGKAVVVNGAEDGLEFQSRQTLVATPTDTDILITNADGQAIDSGKQFSTDGNLTADSDDLIPTQKAVKFMRDNIVVDAGTF